MKRGHCWEQGPAGRGLATRRSSSSTETAGGRGLANLSHSLRRGWQAGTSPPGSATSQRPRRLQRPMNFEERQRPQSQCGSTAEPRAGTEAGLARCPSPGAALGRRSGPCSLPLGGYNTALWKSHSLLHRASGLHSRGRGARRARLRHRGTWPENGPRASRFHSRGKNVSRGGCTEEVVLGMQHVYYRS